MSHKSHPLDVTIRLATPADARAISRLAARDSRRAPDGPVLVAEVDGRLWAARSLTGGRSVADPFVPSGDVGELLRRRARQLAGEPGGRRSGWTLPRLRRAPAGG